jgi:hypothetical protein
VRGRIFVSTQASLRYIFQQSHIAWYHLSPLINQASQPSRTRTNPSAGFVPALLDLIRVGYGIIDSFLWVDLVLGFIPRETVESLTNVALRLSVPHDRLAAGAGIDEFAVCAGCI